MDKYHRKILDILLNDLKIEHELYVIKPGEFFKRISEYKKITNYMSLPHHRNDTAIAFGGGAAGGSAGLVAATSMRGTDFIQIPTTVLPMVDFSIGSKMGIDLPTGRNLIGVFKDLAFCIIGPFLLETLDDYASEDGSREVIKHAICLDEDLSDMISSKRFTKQSNSSEIVEIRVSIKKDIVPKDRSGQNLGRLLNYGRTLGHAAEKLSDYSVMHGHGIAHGVKCMAKRYNKDYGRTLEVLKMHNLDDSYDYSVDDVYDVTLRDEKNTKDIISLIISEEIGDYMILGMNKSGYKKVLSDIYEN